MTEGPALLDRVVERVPLDGHDGRSGARLERIRLDDGTPLVVKRTSPSVDLAMRMTGCTVSREHLLWQAGVLDRRGRRFEHQAGHPVGAIDGDSARDQARTRVPGEHRPLSADAVEKGHDVSGKVLNSVPGRRLVRVAVAALGDRDCTHR